MSQYIITIVPVLDGGVADPVPQTMVRVETDGDRLTVKELTMRAPDGAGLVGGELPTVDFELLLRAFAGRTPGTAIASPRATAALRPGRGRRPAVRHDDDAARQGETRRQSAARNGKTPVLKAGRAYRRAPEPTALEKVYAQTGTIAGVAAHFDVPVHTAQGWISRLRRNTGVTEAH